MRKNRRRPSLTPPATDGSSEDVVMRRIWLILVAAGLVVLFAAPRNSSGCSCGQGASNQHSNPQLPTATVDESTVNGPGVVGRSGDPSDPTSILKPMVYVHRPTQIVIYFESDGQHVSALDPNGRLLWHKNPTEQATNGEKRTDGSGPRVVITSAGPATDVHGQSADHITICIGRESGLLNVRTGDYRTTRAD
jgi:hypothetical protein